jgi:hypothetical protein
MLQPESLVKQLDKDSPNSSFKGDWGPGPLPLGAPLGFQEAGEPPVG